MSCHLRSSSFADQIHFGPAAAQQSAALRDTKSVLIFIQCQQEPNTRALLLPCMNLWPSNDYWTCGPRRGRGCSYVFHPSLEALFSAPERSPSSKFAFTQGPFSINVRADIFVRVGRGKISQKSKCPTNINCEWSPSTMIVQ